MNTVTSKINLNKDKNSAILSVFNFVFNLLSILYMAMLWISVVYSQICTETNTKVTTSRSYNGNNRIFVDTDVYSVLFLERGCCTIAFILSILMLGFGVTCFVLSLNKRANKERVFAGITRFVAGAGAFVVGIMLLIMVI